MFNYLNSLLVLVTTSDKNVDDFEDAAVAVLQAVPVGLGDLALVTVQVVSEMGNNKSDHGHQGGGAI